MPKCDYCDYYTDIQSELDTHINSLHQDQIVNNPYEQQSLDEIKQKKIIEIDFNTDNLILLGVAFGDINGDELQYRKQIVFGLSSTDQKNYDAMLTRATRDKITYPYIIKGKVNGDYYGFIDSTEIENFWDVTYEYIENCLASGWTLKNQVLQATTISGVLNINDDRI